MPLEARKGVRSPRAGLAGDREPPDVGAVNQLGSSARTAYALSLVSNTSSLLNTYTHCHCFSEYFISFFNEAFRPAYKLMGSTVVFSYVCRLFSSLFPSFAKWSQHDAPPSPARTSAQVLKQQHRRPPDKSRSWHCDAPAVQLRRPRIFTNRPNHSILE